jgi:hypothetical protein
MAPNARHAAKRNDRLEWSKGQAATIWGDRLSRVCAIVVVASLWLTVTLTEPAFVPSVLGGAFGVWFLRGHRAMVSETVVDDDWL